jgi:translation initiation factor IF-2
MGHIDHGKSTLLGLHQKIKHRREVKRVESLSIFQRMKSVHKDETGDRPKVLPLSTLQDMRLFLECESAERRSLILRYSSYLQKTQLKLKHLKPGRQSSLAKIPYVVAINKIDRPEANIEKVKNDLIEKGIYLEGYGGDVPFAEISAKIGTNIDQLLDLIILATDLNELKTDPTTEPIGIVIESHRDPKRGVIATLIVKDGVLQKGCFVATDSAYAPTRIMENFLGKPIATAPCSTPVTITGFSELPQVGSFVTVFDSKKDAEKYIFDEKMKTHSTAQVQTTQHNSEIKIIPLIIKTDAGGTQDAIKKELSQLEQDTVKFKFVTEEVGAISEKDIQTSWRQTKKSSSSDFNVDVDPKARALK